jgi:fructokinase
MSGEIVVIGPSLWDVRLGLDSWPKEGDLARAQALGEGPGGAAANTAARLAAHGHSVRLFTRAGDGRLGQRFREACEEPHLAPALRIEALPPKGDLSTCLVLVTQGQRTILWAKDPAEHEPHGPELTEERILALHRASVAWVQVDDDARREQYWQACGGLRGLPAWHLEEELRAGRQWDLLVGSAEDVGLPGQDELRALGCALAVITQGSQGLAYSIDAGGWRHLPATPVEVQDATGAGDAFLAGLLSGLRDGRLPEGDEQILSVLSEGQRYAAQALAEPGGWPAAALD